MEKSNKKIEEIKKAVLELATNQKDVEKWIRIASNYLRSLSRALKKESLSVGRKEHIKSTIAKMIDYRKQIRKLKHGRGAPRNPSRRQDRLRWEDVQSAFKSRLRTGVIINLKHLDAVSFLEDAFYLFAIRIKKALTMHLQLKVNVDFACEYVKVSDKENIYECMNFGTPNVLVDSATNLRKSWDEYIQANLLVQMDEFQHTDSGWSLTSVINLAVNLNKYEPLRGSSYLPLPSDIAAKQACINVQNKDNACFAWAIISALHPTTQSGIAKRTSSYPHYSAVLNLEGITFPMALEKVGNFEKINNHSINIYVLEKSEERHRVVPALLTKEKRNPHINLLMVQSTYEEGHNEPVTYHFCWIKNLSRLVSNQASNHHGAIYICDRCLFYFFNAEKLKMHEMYCASMNSCRIQMPLKGEVVEFNNFRHQERMPFVIYLDTKSFLKPTDKKKTSMYPEYETFSIGYYFKCSYDQELSYYRSYRGKNCANWFSKELLQITENVEPVYWAMQPLQLTLQEEHNFGTATTCHICSKAFTKKNKKVRDHNHLSGDFRGAAHNFCNLSYKDCKTISIVCHNLSKYDAHFLIKDIAQEIQGNIDILPVDKETYVSFTKSIKGSPIKFKFIDSFRFLPYSLDKLASYLDDLETVQREYTDKKQFHLLKRQGVFPHDCIKNWANLDETKLPDQSKFYNKLTDSKTSVANYRHAVNVWTEFSIKTLGEYSDLTLKTDVLLLMDVFENLRKTSLDTYGLDAAFYVSSSCLAWDAMLKYTHVKLELISDVDVLMFIERGFRGGISQCSNRYAKANNKFMPEYDPRKESVYIQYFDMNSFYGLAMSQPLPSGEFKWCQGTNMDILQVPDDGPLGYILEVDLEYPKALHDLHKDLPFCPQQMAPSGSKQLKILTTLYDKERHVIHYRALKQALHHGLKIVKIHRILEFKQTTWMKPYIDLNTTMLTKAQNKFETTIYKCMNKAAFSKTMENVRNNKVVKLVSKWNGRYSAKVLIAKPNFHSRRILDENLLIVQMRNLEIKMNQPIYVGMSILDISKINLYSFHYDFMVNLGYEVQMLYCDTDNFVYKINCSDIYFIMKNNMSYFDTSDYLSKNSYGIPPDNKKVPGLMKDKLNGSVCTEFAGVRSKMYSIRIENQDFLKKDKHVKDYVIKNNITFSDYVDSLVNQNTLIIKQNGISLKQTKITVNDDHKRKLLPNSTATLPWGHYSLNKM